MKKAMSLIKKPASALAARAGQAVLEQLPVDQKKLRRAVTILEKTNLKRLGVVAVSGAAVFSIGGTALQARLTRAALRRELKRQLAPINKKLDELEAQNKELREQNEELRRALKRKV